jgi:hypothetical protein
MRGEAAEITETAIVKVWKVNGAAEPHSSEWDFPSF